MKAKKYLQVPIWWPDFPGNWRAWLPSRGNVLFTLLVVAGLLWAQSAGALPLGRVTGAPLQTSTTIAYQGRLADANGNPLTGTYNMIFRLYDVPTGGTPLWEEQWTGSNAVKVSDGLFNVMLGSLTAIPQSVIAGRDQLWLGITVGTDDEMQPRVQLGSVPWAVQALTVPDGSITTAKIADGAVTSSKMNPTLAIATFNDVTTTATNWASIPGASVSITTSGPAQFLCIGKLDLRATGTAGDISVGIFKGTALFGQTLYNYDVQGHFDPLMVVGVTNTNASGTHTFELRWRTQGGELNAWNGVLLCMYFYFGS